MQTATTAVAEMRQLGKGRKQGHAAKMPLLNSESSNPLAARGKRMTARILSEKWLRPTGI